MNNMNWYNELYKPWFTPAPEVFPIVWIVLYITILISLIFFLRGGLTKSKLPAFFVFILQMVINFTWRPIYFGMENTFLGFILALVLAFFVLLTTIMFFKHSKTAAILLIPYFLWTCFATYLSYKIYYLN